MVVSWQVYYSNAERQRLPARIRFRYAALLGLILCVERHTYPIDSESSSGRRFCAVPPVP